jgi:hypothetical protein
LSAMRLISSSSFFARFAVIDLVRADDRLAAVEPVEHLEIGRDGRHVASGDRFGPICITGATRSDCSFA